MFLGLQGNLVLLLLAAVVVLLCLLLLLLFRQRSADVLLSREVLGYIQRVYINP